MTVQKKKVAIIILAVVLILAAVFIGLYASGNLNATPTDYAASLTIENGEEVFYETAAEAWNNIPAGEFTVMKLYKDWAADSNGNMGEGKGFSNNGIIVIEDRSDNLNIDLNGHTIDRGLYNPSKGIDKPKSGGSVFYFCADATVAISNGTIRGGNTIGGGGGIFFGGKSSNGRLRLYDMTFTSNKATEEGSAIYYDNFNTQELTLQNVTITGNTCGADFGGALYTESSKSHGALYLHGTIKIKDNSGPKDHGNNVSLTCLIKEAETIAADSEIHLHVRSSKEFIICSNLPDEYHDRVKSVIKPEYGRLESQVDWLWRPTIAFYRSY